jgi:hypothetical protein
MRTLLKLAPGLALLGAAVTRFRTDGAQVIRSDVPYFAERLPRIVLQASRYDGDDSGPPFDVGWFTEHAGHDLAVCDEYGGFDDECAKWVRCGECGDSHHCRLGKEHEGPCSARAATATLRPPSAAAP